MNIEFLFKSILKQILRYQSTFEKFDSLQLKNNCTKQGRNLRSAKCANAPQEFFNMQNVQNIDIPFFSHIEINLLI